MEKNMEPYSLVMLGKNFQLRWFIIMDINITWGKEVKWGASKGMWFFPPLMEEYKINLQKLVVFLITSRKQLKN